MSKSTSIIISVSAKGVDTVFKKGFEPGVLGTMELVIGRSRLSDDAIELAIALQYEEIMAQLFEVRWKRKKK